MTQQRVITKVLAGQEDLLLKGEGVADTVTQTRNSGDVAVTPISVAIVLDLIADLRNQTSEFFTMALTKGGTAIGDNVEGTWFWDVDEAGADDSTNIIAVVGVATGRWVRTHYGSVNPSIAATPGGGQADAAELDRELNAILTVATAADSVKLPLAKAGMVCYIVNKSANPCDIFPGSGDFLDTALVNVQASLAAGAKISYRAIDDATWVSF